MHYYKIRSLLFIINLPSFFIFHISTSVNFNPINQWIPVPKKKKNYNITFDNKSMIASLFSLFLFNININMQIINDCINIFHRKILIACSKTFEFVKIKIFVILTIEYILSFLIDQENISNS